MREETALQIGNGSGAGSYLLPGRMGCPVLGLGHFIPAPGGAGKEAGIKEARGFEGRRHTWAL